MTDTSDSEWPKTWSEIRTGLGDDEKTPFAPQDQWVNFIDGMRGYDGTLYVSVDVGHETDENRDLWLPFDEYINHQLESDTDSRL
ncbi:hypothetical protein [Natrinema thermotolerans]|uniref:hypothetical protein n=1 Tax=Natrinema thermotolerans TaxID=121872 RepID=UPI000678A00C|nr:hypothetical protein [Natrinema thermotolerans]QCC57241.1 hypothetical protein DVR14_00780 [Natrinema thermotolerans]